jgi:2'-5' RNA ligase
MGIEQYSIAICLQSVSADYVGSMKVELGNIIGNYGSIYSCGHITFNSFEGYFTKNQIDRIKINLERFCNSKAPVQIRFANLSSYFNRLTNKRTLFLAPDEPSKIILKDLMKLFRRDFKIYHAINIIEPHLTIARNLNHEDFDKAMKLFEGRVINLEFLCSSLCLRKFNRLEGQYNVIGEFLFSVNPIVENIQTTLF